MSISRRQAARVLVATIVFFGLAGVAYEVREVSLLAPFDLDGERTLPALFSAVLLIANAVVLIRFRDAFGGGVVPWSLGIVLAFAGIDEAVQIHERLERQLEVDWQRLYAPAIVLTGVLCASFLRRIWSQSEGRQYFIVSITALATSQVLEYFQWNGDRQVNGYGLLMVTEEVLEMTGSALMLLGLLSISAQWRHGREPNRDPRSSQSP